MRGGVPGGGRALPLPLLPTISRVPFSLPYSFVQMKVFGKPEKNMAFIFETGINYIWGAVSSMPNSARSQVCRLQTQHGWTGRGRSGPAGAQASQQVCTHPALHTNPAQKPCTPVLHTQPSPAHPALPTQPCTPALPTQPCTPALYTQPSPTHPALHTHPAPGLHTSPVYPTQFCTHSSAHQPCTPALYSQPSPAHQLCPPSPAHSALYTKP